MDWLKIIKAKALKLLFLEASTEPPPQRTAFIPMGKDFDTVAECVMQIKDIYQFKIKLWTQQRSMFSRLRGIAQAQNADHPFMSTPILMSEATISDAIEFHESQLGEFLKAVAESNRLKANILLVQQNHPKPEKVLAPLVLDFVRNASSFMEHYIEASQNLPKLHSEHIILCKGALFCDESRSNLLEIQRDYNQIADRAEELKPLIDALVQRVLAASKALNHYVLPDAAP